MTRKSVSFGMRKSRVGAQLEGARRAAASGGVPPPARSADGKPGFAGRGGPGPPGVAVQKR